MSPSRKQTKLPVRKNKKIEEKKHEWSGLTQKFTCADGKVRMLKDVLEDGDWWELKGRKKVAIIVLHSAVKRIANVAGILTNVQYAVLTQPTYENNYQYLIQATISDGNRITTDLGEVNRSNLGPRGRNNPANMAQKRAFDRAVFTHLGIVGVLGEDELQEEEQKIQMDKLTPEQSQQIAPLINELLSVKEKAELTKFNTMMKTKAKEFIPEQLDVLRGLWKKRLAELTKSF
jgi:hypothetical protein